MTIQRRRGQTAIVYPQKLVTDRRGEETLLPDMDSPINVLAAFVPSRASRAEVPGQQQINVYRMLIDPDIEGAGLWARVEWRGLQWDIVSPAMLHHGNRHVRHQSLEIRQWPS